MTSNTHRDHIVTSKEKTVDISTVLAIMVRIIGIVLVFERTFVYQCKRGFSMGTAIFKVFQCVQIGSKYRDFFVTS